MDTLSPDNSSEETENDQNFHSFLKINNINEKDILSSAEDKF